MNGLVVIVIVWVLLMAALLLYLWKVEPRVMELNAVLEQIKNERRST